MTKPTDVSDFISSLDGAAFEKKTGVAISEVCEAVTRLEKGQKGSVTLKLDFTRLGASNQVMVSHEITKTVPTEHGKKTSQDKKATPMHVGEGGEATLFPPDQEQMFTKNGDIK